MGIKIVLVVLTALWWGTYAQEGQGEEVCKRLQCDPLKYCDVTIGACQPCTRICDTIHRVECVQLCHGFILDMDNDMDNDTANLILKVHPGVQVEVTSPPLEVTFGDLGKPLALLVTGTIVTLLIVIVIRWKLINRLLGRGGGGAKPSDYSDIMKPKSQYIVNCEYGNSPENTSDKHKPQMKSSLQVQDKESRSRKSSESGSNESGWHSASSTDSDGLTEKEVSQPQMKKEPDEKPLIDIIEPSSEDSYNGTSSCLPSNEREPISRQESTSLTMNVRTITAQEGDVATQPKERTIQPSQSTHHLETDSKQVSQLSSIGDHYRCVSDVCVQNLGNEHREEEEDTTAKSLVGDDQHRTTLKEVDSNQQMPGVAEKKLGAAEGCCTNAINPEKIFQDFIIPRHMREFFDRHDWVWCYGVAEDKILEIIIYEKEIADAEQIICQKLKLREDQLRVLLLDEPPVISLLGGFQGLGLRCRDRSWQNVKDQTEKDEIGSLGGFLNVVGDNKWYAFTAAHVVEENGSVDIWLEKSWVDFGHVVKFVPNDIEQPTPIDFAVIQVCDTFVQRYINLESKMKQVIVFKDDTDELVDGSEEVEKTGFQTKSTKGRVQHNKYRHIPTKKGEKMKVIKNLLLILPTQKPFADKKDSGSLVLRSKDGSALGYVYGRSGNPPKDEAERVHEIILIFVYLLGAALECTFPGKSVYIVEPTLQFREFPPESGFVSC